MQSKRLVQVAVILVGVAVGIWHLYLASLAIFLFRTGEPWTSWASVVLGPGATLVAVVCCIFSCRVGGIVLLALATLALAAFAIGQSGDLENLAAFFARITLPVATLGTVALVLSRAAHTTQPAC